MKTNKQRAQDILERVDAHSKTPNQSIPDKKASLRKRNLIISLATSFVVVLGAVFGLVFGLGKGGDDFNIANMYVANFDEYTAIGSGYVAEEQVYNSNMAYADSNNGRNKKHMIGVRKDGKVEKIKISDKEGDKVVEQTWNLTSMLSFNNFTVLEYSKDSTYSSYGDPEYFADYDNPWSSYKTFIMDNRTGKFYSISEIGSNYYYFNRALYNFDASESENCIYFSSFGVNSYYDSGVALYRAYVENEVLKIEKVFDYNLFNDVNKQEVMVDKYDNVYVVDSVYGTWFSDSTTIHYLQKIRFLITKTGNIKPIGEECFRSINGIVYTKDKTKQFDANGEMVDNSFLGCDENIERELLVKKIGNVEYYYGCNLENDNFRAVQGRSYRADIICKITWIDAVVFEFEEIKIDDYNSDTRFDQIQYVVTQDKIYFSNDDKIFSIEITTGNKEVLTSDYIFNTIETDNLGNVIFTAVGNQMTTVNGIIDNEGNISVITKKPEYEVYYIKALDI